MKLTKKPLCLSIIMVFLVSTVLVNVTSASPDTCFYVDPPLIEGTPEGKFEVAINVADAPPSYSWEVYLSWDPSRLELIGVEEGDFLHRWEEDPFDPGVWYPKYDTSIAYTPPDEANPNGEILVTCTLVAELPMNEWASGDGLLVSLEFLALARGTTHLNLFNTRLWDHMEAGYPVSTYYPDEDGLVDATNFYRASLDYWRIRVNGRSGLLSWLLEWLGFLRWAKIFAPRTEVGTENLLEARIKNRGSFDVDVQAFFEIRDSAGYWVATVPSDVVALAAGKRTTLSATWTANSAGVYYITAYGFHSAPPYVPTVTIPGGFSRSFRLSVELPT